MTLLEGEAIACASSGKAGGYLSRSPSMMMPATFDLVHRSFNLHLQLADLLDGGNCYDFRPMASFCAHLEGNPENQDVPLWRRSIALDPIEQRDLAELDQKALGAWCAAAGIACSPEAIERCVVSAQLDPHKFTQALVSYAITHYGLEVVTGPRGEVTQLALHDGVVGVETAAGVVHEGTVVLAMGPWNAHIIRTISSLPASFQEEFPLIGRLCHSVAIRSRVAISEAFALFLEPQRALGMEDTAPDVFLRPRNEIYSSGAVKLAEVPPKQADIRVDKVQTQFLRTTLEVLSPTLRDAPVLAEAACFTPFIGPNETQPTFGPVPGLEGVFVAGGHGVWGICQAPATGEAITSLVLGLPPPFALDDFDPILLMP